MSRSVPALAIVAGLFVTPSARAGDWYVDATADCTASDGSAAAPYCRIADALAVAVGGDAIHVAPGTYAENLSIAADVTIAGSGGAAVTIVDGGALGSVVDVAASATVALDGLTLQNGKARYGAGILLGDGANLTLSNSIVAKNYCDHSQYSDTHGGGIAANGGALVVLGCQISQNRAGLDGGGIWCSGGSATLTDSTLANNRSGYDNSYFPGTGNGGAFAGISTSLACSRCTFQSNAAGDGNAYSYANGAGGCVHVENSTADLEGCTLDLSFARGGGAFHAVDSTVTIADCRFDGSESQTGGALALLGGSTTLVRCAVTNNSALPLSSHSTYGGGMSIYAGTTVDVTDCAFAGNHAHFGGGVSSNGTLQMTRCSIRGNDCSGDPQYDALDGAGVSNWGTATLDGCEVVANTMGSGTFASGAGISSAGTTIVKRCTVAGNGDAVGGGIYVYAGTTTRLGRTVVAGNSGNAADVDGRVVSLGYNCIGDSTGATIVGNTTGNQLDVDPAFVDAANGDYSLSASSPCIDADDPSLAPTGMDLAGNPRLLDGDLDRVLVADLGAREFDVVHLDVLGVATPGGTLTLDTSGVAGLQTFLFAGVAESELAFPRYGALFVDLTVPWVLFPWGTIPSSVDATLDPSLPAPITVFVQEVAVDLATHAGNFGNFVRIDVE
jgi:hypothetical protein